MDRNLIELRHSLYFEMTMCNIIGIRFHSHKILSFHNEPPHLEIENIVVFVEEIITER